MEITKLIHFSIENKIVKEENDLIIRDYDVASLYPNIGITNNFYPLHLSKDFCEIYKNLYEERKKYSKSNPLNGAIKLSLNSVYGMSNSEFSNFYDSSYTLKITLNGQMLLLMLAEKLIERVKCLESIQYNTDGISIRYPKQYDNIVKKTIKQWEDLTKLQMEESKYSKMVIANVNNYIALYTDGKVKRKGSFEYNRGLAQDHSMLIVPKAVEAYFLYNILPEETIANCKNIYNFCKRVLIKDKHHELWQGTIKSVEIPNTISRKTKLPKREDKFFKEVKLQKVTRYIVTNEGKTIMKIMPPLKGKENIRENNVEAGWLCTECNNLNNHNIEELFKQINYDYYINECYKIINQFKEKNE